MTPAEHAKAIEDAAVAYAETTHTQDSSGARQVLKAAIIAGVGAAPEGWRDHAEIYVGDGLFAICEWGDFDLVKGYKWNLSSKIKSGCNYAQAWDSHKTSERRQIRMHSLIMQTPVGMYVDHINGDGLDNRRSNLRVVTHQQNTFNQSQHGGTSGFKGVCFDSETGLWRAYIQANKKRLSLGRHGTEIEAAKAYDTAAKEYFGEYAKLNLN